MTWPWLTSTAVLLFTFIVTLLSVPQTLVGNWQLVKSGVRRVRRLRTVPTPVVIDLDAIRDFIDSMTSVAAAYSPHSSESCAMASLCRSTTT
jgi:hypothetical protein